MLWNPRDSFADAAQTAQESDYYGVGSSIGVTSTSKAATEAALWALQQGGNAADAFITAALTQTVVEPGLTSIGGAFGFNYFNAATGETSVVAGLLGPAADEPYDFDRDDKVTQTGRAMPVPGFLAGVKAAHKKFGRLGWPELFEPAIRHATDGFTVLPGTIDMAQRRGTASPEGKALWIKDGRFLQPGGKLVQTELARTLQEVAEDGPEAFYEGRFARNYVQRAQTDGGKLSLADMAGWKERIKTIEGKRDGNYRGDRVWAAHAGLLTYALHLNEDLDLKSLGPARTSAESVYRQMRIMEEVFLSAKTYSAETHEQFTSPDYARSRADFVLNSPVREVNLDALFNTCFLVVRDAHGNCAWGTHSINTPTAFGAGILVDGVYAAHAINKQHVRGSGPTVPGISTSFALYRDGKPRIIVGSPGFGFVQGPYQYGTGGVEWNLTPTEAMNAPRFTLVPPGAAGKVPLESHYDESIFAMLDKRRIPYSRIRPSASTGLVGALVIDDTNQLHIVQDGRGGGIARAT
jgi:gamma-glutamyltranspeptidase/glutathione hydrolase